MAFALISGTKEAELAPLANAFLYVRAVYNVTYILAHSAPLSLIRSAVFTIGILITLRIFSMSLGNNGMYYNK